MTMPSSHSPKDVRLRVAVVVVVDDKRQQQQQKQQLKDWPGK